MNEIALRPVVPEDRPFLLRVYAGTRDVELEPVPWTGEQKAAFLAQQFAAQTADYERRHGDASFDVILVAGVPAGRLIVTRSETAMHVVDIALLPEHRGHGIGTRLLRELIAEAGSRPLSIHVEIMNPARALYDRLGFVPVSEHGMHVLMERRP